MKTTNTNEPLDAKLAKLQERKAKLTAEALQLQARAAHLHRIQLTHAERLARRVDAHEKIILGALVKKAGLDVYRVDGVSASKQQLNDIVLSSLDCRIRDSSASYDRELILGGLLWLVSVLDRAPGDMVAVPPHGVLRDAGRLAGAHVVEKKTGHPGG